MAQVELIAQRLVRTFLVELLHKLMETLLLLAWIAGCRLRRFRFQRPVKLSITHKLRTDLKP
jgi:hypothetical protein